MEVIGATGRRHVRSRFFGIKILLSVTLVIVATFMLVIGLYYVKKALGIDIFPNIHWPNVVKGILHSF